MTPQRKQDEIILSAIRMRCRNLSSADVAKKLGSSSAYIRAATNRVKEADAVESCEEVSDAYWDRQTPGGEDWRLWGRLPQKAIPTRPDRQVVSARFGGHIRFRTATPDTFGQGIGEADLARIMAQSARSEMQAFAAIFDEEG